MNGMNGHAAGLALCIASGRDCLWLLDAPIVAPQFLLRLQHQGRRR